MQLKLTAAEGAVLDRARAAVGARSVVDVARAVVAVLEGELDGGRGAGGTGARPLCEAVRREVTRRAEVDHG